jgi:hypothetical protein
MTPTRKHPLFDRYLFADYSGAKSTYLQKKHIALADATVEMASRGEANVMTRCYTRESLIVDVQNRLAEATAAGQRVLLGFDHSYSFPVGFYETVTGEEWTSWEQLLSLLQQGGAGLPPVGEAPRVWAQQANQRIAALTGVDGGGPFWGPNFIQRKNPQFPFGTTRLVERRVTEASERRMKTIYQIGGAGAVGLQALFGIGYLARLRTWCREQGIFLFAWPFDGWELPEYGHVLVEVYPTLFNTGPRTDEEDARACALGLAVRDLKGTLAACFLPPHTADARERARLEGWVVGVSTQS